MRAGLCGDNMTQVPVSRCLHPVAYKSVSKLIKCCGGASLFYSPIILMPNSGIKFAQTPQDWGQTYVSDWLLANRTPP
jgi:hypothetical protein